MTVTFTYPRWTHTYPNLTQAQVNRMINETSKMNEDMYVHVVITVTEDVQ